MLPSRSRLERWNPDSLTSAGQSVKASGAAVDRAVTTLATNVKTMPDTRGWSGDAHTAATSMFNRARFGSAALDSYTTAVGQALADGAGAIGDARRNLLKKADGIDAGGQLHVSEQWVVLINGGRMTAEQAAALEKRAQDEQRAVNELLLAVGAADDSTAAKVTNAARARGFEAPNPNDPVSMLHPGAQPPGDEVPNPSSTLGLLQQATLRDVDMSQTVRDTTVETKYDPETRKELATVTTIFMQDGSKHVHTVDKYGEHYDRGPKTTETHYDKNGKMISETESVTFNGEGNPYWTGSKRTIVTMADGTTTTMQEWADGRMETTVHTPDGRQADVPLDVFNHPILMAEGAAISGLEEKAKRGIPMLADETVGKIKVGTKYGGPALAVAGALWDVAVAKSGFDKCVASMEGVGSVTAGILAGAAGSGFGPLGVMAASTLGGMGGQALGNWIGNTFCPR